MLLISLSLFLVYSDNSKNTSNKLDNSKQTVKTVENKKSTDINDSSMTKEEYYKENHGKSDKESLAPKYEKKYKMKNIEKDQNFWNYLKSNHPLTFNLLQSIKDKYPRMYKRLLNVSGRMYNKINETSNPDLKKLFAEQIDNQTKLTESMIKYKESKIREEEFDMQAKDILRNIHQNHIKIIELRLQEMKKKNGKKSRRSIAKDKKENKGRNK